MLQPPTGPGSWGAQKESLQEALQGLAQEPPPLQVQLSQQLGVKPTAKLPLGGAMQRAASLVVLHLVLPLALVRQQVTKPGFPHVERDAHFVTA